MPLQKVKPTSPGRRFQTGFDFSEITKPRPEQSLVTPLPKSGGRNNTGRMTARHRGGGHKRLYRVVDFRRDKAGVPATVKAVEYDPNRSARIALLYYADGAKAYILAPVGLTVGDRVETGPQADIKPGNSLPLANIPLGTTVHAVELRPGRGAQLGRSAGAAIQREQRTGPRVVASSHQPSPAAATPVTCADSTSRTPAVTASVAKASGVVAGSYVMRWQVLAEDGHITRGDIPFQVGK